MNKKDAHTFSNWISDKSDPIVSIKKVSAVTQFDTLTPIIKDQAMTTKITDYGFSNDEIKNLSQAEKVISGLKEDNKENTQTINERKMDQIVIVTSNVAQYPRTASGNLSKAVTKAIYDGLQNHSGVPKAQSKILKENAVKFCEKHDLPTQATPTMIREKLAEYDIDTQTKFVAHTNDKKELTLAEKVCKMVYGAEKTKKVDGIEQTVFVANDITMDEINQLEELMADTKRIFIATQKANEKSNEDTKKDNDETNDVLDALCG